MNTAKVSTISMSDTDKNIEEILEYMEKPSMIPVGDECSRLIIDRDNLNITKILKNISSSELNSAIQSVTCQVQYTIKDIKDYNGFVNIDGNDPYWKYKSKDSQLKDIKIVNKNVYFKHAKVPNIEFHILT